jgi:integrase
MNKLKRKQTWEPTKIPNLFRLKESGIYYGRVKVKGGKQIRKSLKTNSFTVAKKNLRDWLLSLQITKKAAGGTWGAVIEPYQVWLQGQKIKGEITDSTIEYKEELIDNIRNTWGKFDASKLAELTEEILANWQVTHRAKYCATRTNGATTVLREMIAIAVKKNAMTKETSTAVLPGLRYVRVQYDYKRLLNNLPEPPQVIQLRSEVYHRCKLAGTLGGWLFDFLLFSGSRIKSAGDVRWQDVKWNANGNGKLYFRTAKYGPYEIPLFPQLRELLDRIKKEYPNAKPDGKVLPTRSLQTVLANACEHLNLAHLSHHDLRHLFATRCIEAGVDIPTVASWLGHKDGGRTAMMVYGHLRETHSQAQAKTVDFLPKPGQKTDPKKMLGGDETAQSQQGDDKRTSLAR